MGKNVPVKNVKKTIRIIFSVFVVFFVAAGIKLMKLDAAMALSAFTIQSNLLCIIASGVTIIREILKNNPRGRAYIFFKGMTLTSILLTFVIYNFVLKPHLDTANHTQSGSLADTLLHTVVPLMMFGDFLFFEEKGLFRIWYPLGWTAFPVYYVGYTAVYKTFGGVYKFLGGAVTKFPYFFFDYETYGLRTVGIWFLLIAIGFICFSYLLVGLDKILVKIPKVKAWNR
jgi:hypothetical protein